MRDVGKRSRMDHDGRLLDRLHECRHDGIHHEHRQRTAAAEVVGCDCIAFAACGERSCHLFKY